MVNVSELDDSSLYATAVDFSGISYDEFLPIEMTVRVAGQDFVCALSAKHIPDADMDTYTGAVWIKTRGYVNPEGSLGRTLCSSYANVQLSYTSNCNSVTLAQNESNSKVYVIQ